MCEDHKWGTSIRVHRDKGLSSNPPALLGRGPGIPGTRTMVAWRVQKAGRSGVKGMRLTEASCVWPGDSEDINFVVLVVLTTSGPPSRGLGRQYQLSMGTRVKYQVLYDTDCLWHRNVFCKIHRLEACHLSILQMLTPSCRGRWPYSTSQTQHLAGAFFLDLLFG